MQDCTPITDRNARRNIAKEQAEKSIIISVIQPYNDGFACSSDHLPPLLQDLFRPAYLEFDFTQLLTLAKSHHYEVTPAMVDHLLDLTKAQSKSRMMMQSILALARSYTLAKWQIFS